jgi:hypothetical protein
MCQDDFAYDPYIQYSKEGAYICPAGLPDHIKPIILDMYEQYDYHTSKAQELFDTAMDCAKELYWETEKGMVIGEALIENLTTVPFVGPKTALTWMTEIVSPLRFENSSKIAAYCGLDPSLQVSAGKVTSHISRKGNSNLHQALVQIAGICINMHSEAIGKWGYAKCADGGKGKFKKASGAVARRLLVGMYAVHKYNEPFDYGKYEFYKINVSDVKIGDMKFSKRVMNVLHENGIKDSEELAQLYASGILKQLKGLGAKSVAEIEKWLEANKKG